MHVSRIELLFWAAGFCGHITLLTVLLARKRARTFPFFTAFVSDDVIRTIVLFWVFHHGTQHSYLVTYVVFAMFDQILQVCVAYELASHVFRPTGRWAPDVKRGSIILAVASLFVALSLTCMPTPPEKTLWKAMLDRSNLFSSALLSELFLGMIIFSVTAGLPWKTHVARIAQGLGFYSFLGLFTSAGHSVVGMIRSLALSHSLTLLRESTYLICLAYWIVALWCEAPEPKELPEKMRRQLFTLQKRVEYDLRNLRTMKR